MTTRKWFPKVVVVLAVAVMLAMVGTAVASNMAFKINKALLQGAAGGGTANCNTCGNWVSLPLNNAFLGQRLDDICVALNGGTIVTKAARVSQTGSASGSGATTTVDPTFIDDVNSIRTCGAPAFLGSNPPYQSQIGIQVVLTGAVADTSQIFVGSHTPGEQILARNSIASGGTATCSTCGNWVQLPYHTTAQRLNDICLENPNFARVSQTGLASLGGLNTIVDPTFIDDVAASRACGGPAFLGSNPPVQIGKPINAILKTTTVGDVLWAPAHF